ncbi:hypothetical protein D9619_012773 [Psilocybe cf. subviscida]|uniref:Hydrophobin n=1 Tax=Psilocybe cf. subviscida TaxID=2480587 RepID=A0A8H5AQJ7_9AGAR|nr:hypothetical protein D9619_012773 [Psilocybe cf. subviscida]
MHFKFAALTTVAVATLAAATGGSSSLSNQCNTGTLLCCQSVGNPSTYATLLALLGIDVSNVTPLVGVNCSPISVIGISGNSCSAQPVCCTDNSFNGLVAFGCTPINLSL